MALSTRLVSYFSRKIRERGEDVYDDDLVRIMHGSVTEVTAQVQGSQLYELGLVWQEDLLNGWCDCPYFESSGACKHLWATILAAEAQGYLSAAASAKTLDFYYDGVGWDEDFDDGQALRPHSFLSILKPPPPKLPEWGRRA